MLCHDSLNSGKVIYETLNCNSVNKCHIASSVYKFKWNDENSMVDKVTFAGRGFRFKCIYTRAKANFFVDLCRCSINTQIGNNATDRKRRRVRSNINAPLSEPIIVVSNLKINQNQINNNGLIFIVLFYYHYQVYYNDIDSFCRNFNFKNKCSRI